MTNHKIGDLVYYRDTLGYIEGMDDTLYPSDIQYSIRWFNPKVEDDVSTAWHYDVSKMKAQLYSHSGLFD